MTNPFGYDAKPYVLSKLLLRAGENVHQDSALARVLSSSSIKPKLDELLYTKHHHDKNTKFHDYYVRNRVDNFIDYFCQTTVNKTAAIVGPTGSGKSSTIRNRFGLDLGPTIQENELRIPFYFDNRIDTSKKANLDHIISQIELATTYLKQKLKIEVTAKSVIEFIKQTKETLVAEAAINQNLLNLPSDAEIVESLKQKHYLGFVVSSLKHVLHEAHTKFTPIKYVYLLADDIEAIEEDENIVSTIRTILSCQTCLENMGGLEKPTILCTLLSMRPATYEALKRADQVNGFTIPSRPEQLEPINILDMFKQKLDVNIKVEQVAENKKHWKTAFRIVENICDSLRYHHANFFIGISNYNIRQACQLIERVLIHSHWYENSDTPAEAVQGAINLSEDDYHMTQAALVRSLALSDHSVYQSRNSQGIPNLFFNENFWPALLVGPLIAKYCATTRNDQGYSTFTRKEISKALKFALDGQIVDQILDKILNYFCDNLLLRKIKIRDEHYVSQPMMTAIWGHLSSSSVFLECFRDDSCIKHFSIEANSELQKPSSILREGTFFAAIDMLYNTCLLEMKVLSKLEADNPVGYYSSFGGELISEKLLNGIQTSLGNFYRKRKKTATGRNKRRIIDSYLSSTEALVSQNHNTYDRLIQTI